MKTYREELKDALARAHMAAMESGSMWSKEDYEHVTADTICRHFAGVPFDRLVMFTKGQKYECTGGRLYIGGFVISVGGNCTNKVRLALAHKLLGIERLLLAQEVLVNG